MAQQHDLKARPARPSWGAMGRGGSRLRRLRPPVLEHLEVRSLLAAATQLVVVTEPPASVAVNQAFGLVVDAEDASGVLDSSYTGAVTLALLSNPGNATLGGSVSVTASGGVATFPGVSINQIADGYTLQVTGGPSTAGGVTGATSSSIDVTPLPATQLVVTTPPTGVTVNNAFTVVVSAENGQGQVDPSFSGTVTVALGTNPAGATLGGTLTEPAVDGVATFPDLTLNQIAGGYTLQFTTGGLTGVATPSFRVAPAPATALVVAAEPPSNVVAGNPFGFVVDAMNPQAQIDTSYNGPVTVAFASPNGNPTGASLLGTTTVNAVNGVANFSNLAISKGGTGFVLQVTSGSLTAATTTAINATVQPATQVAFLAEPPHAVAQAAPFGLSVAAESPQGTIDPTYTGNVTLVLLNPGSATLGGTLTEPLVNGVATFAGLTLDQVGVNYQVQASTGGLTPTASTSITVTPAPATHLVVTVQPPTSVGVGSVFGLTISAENGQNLVDPNFGGTVTLALASGPAGATLSGLLTATPVAGVATFAGLTLDQVGGGYTLQATAAGLSAATTSTFSA
ncbi:MAG: hypothetical protein P4L84_16050, partial [Isosphaeraceae bacterium]|nr:hypothetical protein [Isosphaeraceae bacterium]